tara:strand:+ start:6820 stop:7572 length:753 start_codon:yes stop_codon:yes gene_type:complete
MKSPKVLIGCPTFIGKKYCINKYLNGLRDLDYDEKYFTIVDNSKGDEYIKLLEKKGIKALKGPHYPDDPARSVYESRNLLREKFLEGDFEYFLSLEQDVVLPRDGLKTLLENNQRVVSGVYFVLTEVNNKPAMAPMAFVKVDQEWFDKIKKNPKTYKDQYEMLKKHDFDINKVVRRLRLPEVKGENSMEVQRVGLGAMLIHRDVLEKIKFRKNPNGFDDMTFCEDVLKNNWKIMLDTGVKCQHFLEKGGE